MTFLSPWFLALAAAASVPLLIHLLRRRIALRLEFPAARYLARAERDHSRTLRMRNLLLLILRTLAIMAIAIAAARPRVAISGAGHSPTALAIVLDNSMSTGVVEQGTPLLDRLKQRARDVLSSATADDRVWLVTAEGTVRGGNVATLRDELDRVRPYAGAGVLRDVVERALTTVSSAGLDARQVVVLTDGQRTAWTDPAPNRADVPVVVWMPASTPPANRAVMLAEARPARWTPHGAVAARILSTDTATYRVTLGGRTLARGTAVPGEETLVRATPPERGWLDGTVEIEPDELPTDNVRYFALWLGAAPNVRVASDVGPFAKNAVDVLGSSDQVTQNASGDAIAIASADAARALPALLLPPIDAVRIGAANRTLERLGIPWRFGPMRRETAIARGDGLPSITVSWRYELVPQNGGTDATSDVLARVGASPWIVAGDRYVIIASPLVPEATTLPVSAPFLPWLENVLASRLEGDPGTVRFAAPGERVTPPPGAQALESASGARTSLSGTQFDAPAAAGVYFYIEGARRAGALVVNPEPEESRLDRWPGSAIAAHVAASGTHEATRDDDLRRMAFASVAGRPVAMPLLLLAVVALLFEGILATGAGSASGGAPGQH